MKEERALENMSAVKQKDLAALVSFLETEIYTELKLCGAAKRGSFCGDGPVRTPGRL
jgi:hypothetical protein